MLVNILLPMVKNGVVVVVILTFGAALGRGSAGQDPQHEAGRPDPAGRAGLRWGGLGAWAWPHVAAIYVMAIAPGLIVFGFAQRWYLRGLQEGALKG